MDTAKPLPELTDAQLQRYARNVILDEVGEEGQARLLAARVLVVGAGGLGTPLIQYLAAAGVGTLGVVDDDVVDLTNLQRQVLHTTARVGMPKVDSAAAAIGALNPETKLIPHHTRLTVANAAELIGAYDLVADGSDNFATRYLINDACYLHGKPLITAALLRFEGQVFTFKRTVPQTACYRCVFSEAPAANLVQRCETAGVLGPLCGVLGSLQATEVLKEIMGIGDSTAGTMLLYDALGLLFRKVKLKHDPACALCGDHPTMTDLSHHADTGKVC
ncbi:MAG: molybdopterin-synthase adenylyltransferase MoeB [Alphaproteobacteria bacterium]|nr:molybdopterin-synthase adenylyltransferase MoeB [Alphaproteobacteria bacterium]